MKLSELRKIGKVLKSHIGWTWPIFTLKSLRKRKLFIQNTRWENTNTPEAEFVNRLTSVAALYSSLRDMKGERVAFEIMEEIVVPIGTEEQMEHYRTIIDFSGSSLDRLRAFHRLMDEKGNIRFNIREYVQNDETVCHFIVTRCVFHDYFLEVGMPELTRFFCEVDDVFFSDAYPDLHFHRDGEPQNTIAYGKEYCTFVFENIS